MATRVIVNAPAFIAWLETNPAAQASLGTTAKAVETGVVQAAPVGVSLSWPRKIPGEPWIRRPMRHGRFRDSIGTKKTPGGWRVQSTDPFAHLIEWGSVKNPPYAAFRRTMRLFHHSETGART